MSGNSSSAVVSLFCVTVFTSAFLLFQVQPVIGKFILPWFGSSPGVWATCMLFFQVLLLAGYGYAHFTVSRFSRKQQALLHCILLVIALITLPIAPSPAWKPVGVDAPLISTFIDIGGQCRSALPASVSIRTLAARLVCTFVTQAIAHIDYMPYPNARLITGVLLFLSPFIF